MSLTLDGLAPPASLRLDRPVWGVDPGSTRMAFGALLPQGGGKCPLEAPRLEWHTVRLMKADAVHLRWARAGNGLHAAVASFKRDWGGAPALVVIEQPFSTGHQTEPSSYYAIAMLLGALGQLGLETDVRFLPPQSWKSLATGKGHGAMHVKEKTARYRAEKKRLVEWANGVGYSGHDSNEADAVGLATAAGVLLEQKRSGR